LSHPPHRFWVDDVVEQGKIARNAGADLDHGLHQQPARLRDQATDLNGIIFDIAATAGPARR